MEKVDTGFLAIQNMQKRLGQAKEQSDSAFFDDLMLTGELLLKLAVIGMIGAVGDDPERNRYSQIHKLVRADSLGSWTQVLDEVLLGPPASFLRSSAYTEQAELSKQVGEGTWQYEFSSLINHCLKQIHPDVTRVPTKTSARNGFMDFVTLRNKSRGHGALRSATKSDLAEDLNAALAAFSDNFSLFDRQWAYLHRNLSGKYKVTLLNSSARADLFEPLRRSANFNFGNGIYIDFDEVVGLDLIWSDADASDIYLANGSFNGNRFEALSYETGSTKYFAAERYLSPASSLPASETQGLGKLEALSDAEAFTNLPAPTNHYVPRPELERRIIRALTEQPSLITTLVGKGGIGKTSLALEVLNQIQYTTRFDLILWFSSRDVDLLTDGPRRVNPNVLDHVDVAREFVELMSPAEAKHSGFDPVKYLSDGLKENKLGGRTLFVFDNFETVQDPVGLFNWIYTYLREPNRALITTRHRNFNGDFEIAIDGMRFDEARQLIAHTARSFQIAGLITSDYSETIYREADGHPYVMKILIGEVAKQNRLVPVKSIFSGNDDLLPTLFERTYSNLSHLAKRCFLTLCDWRSSAPEIALEAVLLKSTESRIDVKEAVTELHRSSFVDITTSKRDNANFVSVPLVARLFGESKLKIDPLRTEIQHDRALLQAFGATQTSDIEQGFQPRVEEFLAFIAKESEKRTSVLDEFSDIFEFLGRSYHASWLQLASLFEEVGGPANLKKGKDFVSKYLEKEDLPLDDQRNAWKLQALLSSKTKDVEGEAHAILELCRLPDTWFPVIAEGVHRINTLIKSEETVANQAKLRLFGTELAKLMQKRLEEATASHCSQLAWLWIHVGEPEKADPVIERGLVLEPTNRHCLKLKEGSRPPANR